MVATGDEATNVPKNWTLIALSLLSTFLFGSILSYDNMYNYLCI